jgi:hypothetical protein
MAQGTVNERIKNYLIANPPATTASGDVTTDARKYVDVNRTAEATATFAALIAAAAAS